jgi:hypothetical protein
VALGVGGLTKIGKGSSKQWPMPGEESQLGREMLEKKLSD